MLTTGGSSGGQPPAAIMDDDAGGPKSLIVVVDYDYSDKGPYFCSILHLDIDDENHQGNNDEVIETEFSVHLCLPQSQLLSRLVWSFSPLGISTEDLYMVPDMFGHPYKLPVPLQGCIFNLRNNKCRQIKTPQAPKQCGLAVSMGGHLYFMAIPQTKYLSPPIFERHDPSSDCWEPLQPFPNCHGDILAIAVLDDTILFNMRGQNICAYNAPNNEWYPVSVDNDLAYCIRGEAVVLGDTIYALEDDYFNSVLVISVGREIINGDLEFRFSLLSKIIVSGIKEIEDEDKDIRWYPNLTHLAYLGNGKFCLVRSCKLLYPKEYQSIQVINMKLEGENSMTVKNTRFYKIKLDDCKTEFRVRLCFSSLLNCKTTPLEQGKPSVVEFDPFPKYTGNKREREGDIDCHRDQATPRPAYPAFPAYRYPPPPPPPYYHPPDYHYPQAPAIPSPPPYYQHPAYHYPQAPAIPSPPPYYQHPMPHPPNTPLPWPSNPQDYCQLCGLQGHIATNCSTYMYYKINPLYS